MPEHDVAKWDPMSGTTGSLFMIGRRVGSVSISNTAIP